MSNHSEYPSYIFEELFQFLNEQSEGLRWVCRRSTTGRGYRLHTVLSHEDDYFNWKTFSTSEEAVMNAMKQSGQF